MYIFFMQNEFRDIAKHFQSHPHIRLVLKYDEALSHSIYAASDMFIVPSIFEPCGLTQVIVPTIAFQQAMSIDARTILLFHTYLLTTTSLP